jgi:hypothetical protein
MGAESPTSAGIVRATLKGIRRTLGTAAAQKSAGLTTEIRAMLAATKDSNHRCSRYQAFFFMTQVESFRYKKTDFPNGRLAANEPTAAPKQKCALYTCPDF